MKEIIYKDIDRSRFDFLNNTSSHMVKLKSKSYSGSR